MLMRENAICFERRCGAGPEVFESSVSYYILFTEPNELLLESVTEETHQIH